MGCVHDSVSIRHCERQVPVVGLQNPTQHSESTEHITPAALHIAPRQTLPAHVPSQQSPCSMHEPPMTAQPLFRQSDPLQVAPVQQSGVAPHDWPGTPQVPSPAQRFDRQLREQQIAGVEQPTPSPAQPHMPLRHAP